MRSDELLTLFREEAFDLETPSMWSDGFIYQAIDEAQNMFCRLTDGIADASSPAAQLQLEAGEPWATLSPTVLHVRRARDERGRELPVLPVETFLDDGGVLSEDTGALRMLVSGLEDHRLRVVNVPEQDATIWLSIFRLPLHTIHRPGQELEIPRQYHRTLLHWVMHLAYGKQDAETFDKGRALEFEASFRKLCEGIRLEQQRLRRTHRAIAYGGL